MAEAKTKLKTDLSSLDTVAGSEEGAWMEVCHPVTGEPLDGGTVRIKLAGPDSKVYRHALNSGINRRLVKNANKMQQTVEMSEADAIQVLAKATMDWKNLHLDGEDVKFSKEAALDIYRTIPWIKEQVDEFLNERANFLGN